MIASWRWHTFKPYSPFSDDFFNCKRGVAGNLFCSEKMSHFSPFRGQHKPGGRAIRFNLNQLLPLRLLLFESWRTSDMCAFEMACAPSSRRRGGVWSARSPPRSRASAARAILDAIASHITCQFDLFSKIWQYKFSKITFLRFRGLESN